MLALSNGPKLTDQPTKAQVKATIDAVKRKRKPRQTQREGWLRQLRLTVNCLVEGDLPTATATEIHEAVKEILVDTDYLRTPAEVGKDLSDRGYNLRKVKRTDAVYYELRELTEEDFARALARTTKAE